MPNLKEKPCLKDYQDYVKELEFERGFIDQSTRDKCLLLGEEVGELFKAVRKKQQIKIDKNSKVTTIGEELADIFIYLCAIANRFDINLEEAFRLKEEVNKKRKWE